MKTYTYIAEDEIQEEEVQVALTDYMQEKKLDNTKVVTDEEQVKVHWSKRKINDLLNEASSGDNIVVYSASCLACSTAQVLEVLQACLDKGVNIHFVKYNRVFLAKNNIETSDILKTVYDIESEFIARRTTDALARRRASGLPLGRPKGSKNKSLKLDKYKEEIVKYLKLRVSKASIAKLINCHPQTLYDWIDRNGVRVEEDEVVFTKKRAQSTEEVLS